MRDRVSCLTVIHRRLAELLAVCANCSWSAGSPACMS